MHCTNPFLESDGYCTQCGRNHLASASKRGKMSTPAPATREVQSPPPDPNLRGEYRALTLRAVTVVSRDRGFTVEVLFSRRRRKSTHSYDPRTRLHSILFGSAAIAGFAQWGYHCTLLAQNVATYNRFGGYPTGRTAVILHALHELAHAVTAAEHGPGHHHDSTFFEVYEDLVNEYLSTLLGVGWD